MSIVERALHKNKQLVKAAPGRMPDAEPVDPALLTARDLKALVEIDYERMRQLGRMPPLTSQLRVNEELRRIKWPLLKAIAGRGALAPPLRNNVVLITSAMPSEGKSFTALNLALSIARDRDMRVVLVDGDVARPALTPALGLDEREGLNDVLEDPDRDVNDVIYRTSVEGLFFVPAGKWHDYSPELFSGPRMEQVLTNLSHRAGNGVVLLDSPPLLATNEAQAATGFVGQVLLIVRADHTEQRAVLDALALVDKSTPVNAVLNRVEPSIVSKYYGQYYYGYGSDKGYMYGRGETPGKEGS